MFTTDELNQIKTQYGAMQAQSKNKPVKKKSSGGITGALQSLLPIAGGALGAIGGTFLGGPAGTIAGGAAGAGLGEGLKEKLQGNDLNVGNIAKEAAFGAIPGIGSGFKALRAGGTAASLIRGGAAAAAPEVAATTATRGSLKDKVAQAGLKMESRSGGFGQGEKQAGKDALGYYDTENISKNLADEGIKGGSASARQRAVDDALLKYSGQIDEAVKKGNKPFKPTESTIMSQKIHDNILGENGRGVAGFDPTNKTHNAIVNNYTRQLAKVEDTQGLLNFKRSLDKDAINYGRNSNAPDPIREALAKEFRLEVNKEFGRRLPKAKTASGKYAGLSDANEFLKQASRDASNAATQPGASITGRLLTSDAATAAKSKLGIAAQKVAGSTPAPAPATPSNILGGYTAKNVAKAGVQQAVPRAVIGGLGIGADTTENNLVAPEATGSTTPGTAVMDATQDATASIGNTSQYPLENLMADIQRDPKNASTYLSVFKEVQDTEAAQNPSLSAAQQKTLMGANTATQLVDQIEGSLNQIPESGRVSGTIAKLSGKAGLNDTVQAYEQQRPALALMLIKAVQGSAGQISDADRNAINDSIPSTSDTTGERQQKLQRLRAIIGAYQGAAGQNYGQVVSGTGTDNTLDASL